jgi:hypothetical protein
MTIAAYTLMIIAAAMMARLSGDDATDREW